MLSPLVQGTFCLILLGMPTLLVVVGGMVLRSSINYGTGRAVREVFFTPLDRDAKYRAKGLIDTVVFRTGDGLASLLLVGGNLVAHSSVGPHWWPVLPALAVVLLWLLAARALAGRFGEITTAAALHGAGDPDNLEAGAAASRRS